MQVYKFGGASIATPERMKALLPIIQQAPKDLVIVVSAMGKTTNALEQIVNASAADNKTTAYALAATLEESHNTYASALLKGKYLQQAIDQLNVYYTELHWAIDDASNDKYDYCYDQIVCIGEMLSTVILSHYLLQEGYQHNWLDVRDVIRTNHQYRDASIDYSYTQQKVNDIILPLLKNGVPVLTQGFIGATDENTSTTLGREGSDYTAAVLAAMCGAEAVTIWKDVAGLLNADPKKMEQVELIPAISYYEVIEMAYYGAQVIHPKTIKPLYNNNIPLHVRCFLQPDSKGTVITNEVKDITYPPLIVWKENQMLLQFTTRDFSFITEDSLSHLYHTFDRLHIKINMIQNAAISFVACIDKKEDKLQELIDSLITEYRVLRNEDMTLLTVRHYTPEIVAALTHEKQIFLEQKTRNTIQVLVKR